MVRSDQGLYQCQPRPHPGYPASTSRRLSRLAPSDDPLLTWFSAPARAYLTVWHGTQPPGGSILTWFVLSFSPLCAHSFFCSVENPRRSFTLQFKRSKADHSDFASQPSRSSPQLSTSRRFSPTGATRWRSSRVSCSVWEERPKSKTRPFRRRGLTLVPFVSLRQP
jgi:hypothetical protein